MAKGKGKATESPTPSPLSSPPLALSLDEDLFNAWAELAKCHAAEAKAVKAATTKAATKKAIAQAQPVADPRTDTPVPKKSSSRHPYIDELYGDDPLERQPTQAARSSHAIPEFPPLSIPQIFPRKKPSLQPKAMPSSCTIPPAPFDQCGASTWIPLQQPSHAPLFAADRAPPLSLGRAPPLSLGHAPPATQSCAPSVVPSGAPPVVPRHAPSVASGIREVSTLCLELHRQDKCRD